MTFWRPAEEMRGVHGYWFTDASLMRIEMSKLAARAIYRCFNLIPETTYAANDRDHVRW